MDYHFNVHNLPKTIVPDQFNDVPSKKRHTLQEQLNV